MTTIYLYHKRIGDCWWNYREVRIFAPNIGKWHSRDDWGSDVKYYGADLSTKVVYSKDEHWWNFTVALLGFGVEISRQKGY